ASTSSPLSSTTLAQRLGAVAEPVSLPIASRYCTLPSRIRSAVPVIRPLRSRKVVTLPLVELLAVIWPRSFRNVCCCATAGPTSSARATARVIVLIVRSSRLANEDRCDLMFFKALVRASTLARNSKADLLADGVVVVIGRPFCCDARHDSPQHLLYALRAAEARRHSDPCAVFAAETPPQSPARTSVAAARSSRDANRYADRRIDCGRTRLCFACTTGRAWGRRDACAVQGSIFARRARRGADPAQAAQRQRRGSTPPDSARGRP